MIQFKLNREGLYVIRYLPFIVERQPNGEEIFNEFFSSCKELLNYRRLKKWQKD